MFNVTLAEPYEPKRVHFPAVVMPKLDGVRAVLRLPIPGDDGPHDGQYHFYSRGGSGSDKEPKCWNDNVIAHILTPLRSAIPTSANVILDGEFYRHGWKLQKINGAIAVKRKEPKPETLEVRWTIFDAAGAVASLPFPERLKHAIKHADGIVNVDIIDYSMARSVDEIAEFHSNVLGQGYEGTIVRNFQAPYENKRTFNLLKFKNFIDAEFKCVGVYEGKETDKGSRLVGTLGGLTLHQPSIHTYHADGALYCDKCTFGCGSGFDDTLRAEIWANPSSVIDKMITIQYFDLSVDGTPRMGTFRAVRDYE